MIKISCLLLALLGFSSSQAQMTSTPGKKYREFAVNLNVSNGETKAVVLQVNTDLEVVAYGDPEIEAHGHYDYIVTGWVVEGEHTCKFDLLLTQGRLEKLSTEQVLLSRQDRTGSLMLCSGLSLGLVSVRNLMIDTTMSVSLNARGLNKAIGTGMTVTRGLKEVPEYEPKED